MCQCQAGSSAQVAGQDGLDLPNQPYALLAHPWHELVRNTDQTLKRKFTRTSLQEPSGPAIPGFPFARSLRARGIVAVSNRHQGLAQKRFSHPVVAIDELINRVADPVPVAVVGLCGGQDEQPERLHRPLLEQGCSRSESHRSVLGIEQELKQARVSIGAGVLSQHLTRRRAFFPGPLRHQAILPANRATCLEKSRVTLDLNWTLKRAMWA